MDEIAASDIFLGNHGITMLLQLEYVLLSLDNIKGKKTEIEFSETAGRDFNLQYSKHGG